VEEPTEFELWKNATLTKDKNRLYDLLGVLHIRKNQLPEALAAFEKVETFFWNNEHFQTYFSEDPFANNFISERNSESDDRYTKPQLVEKLIQLKSKINSSSGDEKAKYAFQVANCYRNMTYYGTAWLMRRYYWSGSHNDAGLVDDAEYRNADLAKEYYSMAYKSAKTKDFKALSLRMVGRCEKYKLFNAYESSPYEQGKYDQIFTGNKYYKQLKKEFPNEYDDLISNCASLYGYYSSIK
jgi:hypothetical protein